MGKSKTVLQYPHYYNIIYGLSFVPLFYFIHKPKENNGKKRK